MSGHYSSAIEGQLSMESPTRTLRALRSLAQQLGASSSTAASSQSRVQRRLAAVIMGPPGGGKGTISAKIVDDFGFYHISTGDELRRSVLFLPPALPPSLSLSFSRLWVARDKRWEIWMPVEVTRLRFSLQISRPAASSERPVSVALCVYFFLNVHYVCV